MDPAHTGWLPMSPVEFWASRRVWSKANECSIDRVFDPVLSKKILLVENQVEHDYCWAMQLVMGDEVRIELWDRELTVAEYCQRFSWVFTTWDPSDRNRI